MTNLSMASKNQTRNQKSTRVQICFFTNFQGTKTRNMNSHAQVEQFDTKISILVA